MNETAKKLREAANYMVGSGANSAHAIATVRGLFDVVESDTFGEDLGAVLDVIADELDELQARAAGANNLRQKLESAEKKAERRKKQVEHTEDAIRERNARLKMRAELLEQAVNENRELRKQVPTGRERQILAMWPRFEDGEPVMPGDKVHYASAYNDETEIEVESITVMDCLFVPCDGECRSNQYEQGQRVKRPAPKVLDADGVEIKVGDTVYGIGRTEHRFEVIGPHHIDPEVGEAFSVRCYDRDEHEECHCKPKLLTHTRPDSWERLAEDATKNYAAYWGCGMSTCAECPKLIDGKTPYERFGCLHCLDAMRLDLIRRAKRLAGIEVD